MAEPGLIAAYLAELRHSLASLRQADDVLAEVEDHLRSAAQALEAAGRPRHDAEALAGARFGSAELVARAHREEAKRGAAVSTRLSRRAGVAAMAAPVLAVVGQLGNTGIEDGPLHGAAVGVLLAAAAAFAFALYGLRARHGGLGGWGRAAFWLFVASPFIAAPFAWGAGAALAVVHLVVLTLLGIGMVQARVLPPAAVALFTFAAPATLVTAAALTALDVDAAAYVPLGAAACAAGLAWLGWAMWREPALDAVDAPGTRGPLVAG